MVSFPWAPASTRKFGLKPQYFIGSESPATISSMCIATSGCSDVAIR